MQKQTKIKMNDSDSRKLGDRAPQLSSCGGKLPLPTPPPRLPRPCHTATFTDDDQRTIALHRGSRPKPGTPDRPTQARSSHVTDAADHQLPPITVEHGRAEPSRAEPVLPSRAEPGRVGQRRHGATIGGEGGGGTRTICELLS